MLDVHQSYHDDRMMFREGHTLVYPPPGPAVERGWAHGRVYPSMTKEYTGAAVPGSNNNSTTTTIVAPQ